MLEGTVRGCGSMGGCFDGVMGLGRRRGSGGLAVRVGIGAISDVAFAGCGGGFSGALALVEWLPKNPLADTRMGEKSRFSGAAAVVPLNS